MNERFEEETSENQHRERRGYRSFSGGLEAYQRIAEADAHRDHWRTLGLGYDRDNPPSSTDIQKSYKQTMKRLYGEAEQRQDGSVGNSASHLQMYEVNHAYEVLSDPEVRAVYEENYQRVASERGRESEQVMSAEQAHERVNPDFILWYSSALSPEADIPRSAVTVDAEGKCVILSVMAAFAAEKMDMGGDEFQADYAKMVARLGVERSDQVVTDESFVTMARALTEEELFWPNIDLSREQRVPEAIIMEGLLARGVVAFHSGEGEVLDIDGSPIGPRKVLLAVGYGSALSADGSGRMSEGDVFIEAIDPDDPGARRIIQLVGLNRYAGVRALLSVRQRRPRILGRRENLRRTVGRGINSIEDTLRAFGQPVAETEVEQDDDKDVD